MVASNDREAVQAATDYLIAQGHRRIALIAGPQGFRSAGERRQGFQDSLASAGIALPRSMIADGDYTFESGIVAADRLLDVLPRPTAIFASNDEMAAGTITRRGSAGWRFRATCRSSASTTPRSPRMSGRR
jgi:LacI family transcriptional regulator